MMDFVGFKSQFIEMFGNPLSSVQRYPLKNLGDCCELNPRRPSLDLEDTDNVSFVPMPSVSENGYLQDVTDEEYGKVKKGFTYFENGDVLFAKITPCMENGKGAIAEGLTNNIGMGSTEFHVLRPIEGVSSPYWLLALTRLSIFRERASKNMTGTGGQKRVPANYLENFMVGLPPIEEQNRFENIYKQADKSEFELRKSIDVTDRKSLIKG
jgi:type I restriction enzyme S subunit